MRQWLALALIPLASQIAAQDLPALFDVAGVDAADVLNIRAAPSPRAEIIGKYGPDRQGIEVLTRDDTGKWGQVGAGEANGWVALQFLTPAAATNFTQMTCFGTEPFWTLSVVDGASHFDQLGEPRTPVTLAAYATAQNGVVARFDNAADPAITLIAAKSQCSDGMSDRTFGWDARVFVQTAPQNRVLQGCCTLEID